MGKQTGLTNERELVPISIGTEWFNETIQRNKIPFKEATNVKIK